MTASNNHSPDEQFESGESMEEAIVIQADKTASGVSQEYQWVEQHFGKRGVDWQLVKQALLHKDDRAYDMLHIRLADGTEKQFYFDITSFFGKF